MQSWLSQDSMHGAGAMLPSNGDTPASERSRLLYAARSAALQEHCLAHRQPRLQSHIPISQAASVGRLQLPAMGI